MLLGLSLGRLICGFLCPFGLIQELLHKIPGKKIKKGQWSRKLSWLKYAVLAVFVVAIPLWYAFTSGYPLPGFCKYICPAGTLEGGIPLVAMREEYRSLAGWLFTWKTGLCAAILLLCVFCYRAFCRFLCPLGAIYSLFSRVALLAFRVGCGQVRRLRPVYPRVPDGRGPRRGQGVHPVRPVPPYLPQRGHLFWLGKEANP